MECTSTQASRAYPGYTQLSLFLPWCLARCLQCMQTLFHDDGMECRVARCPELIRKPSVSAVAPLPAVVPCLKSPAHAGTSTQWNGVHSS
eukprot:scaffold28323_cov15-Tisochrysis_lutea.AAC.2